MLGDVKGAKVTREAESKINSQREWWLAGDCHQPNLVTGPVALADLDRVAVIGSAVQANSSWWESWALQPPAFPSCWHARTKTRGPCIRMGMISHTHRWCSLLPAGCPWVGVGGGSGLGPLPRHSSFRQMNDTLLAAESDFSCHMLLFLAKVMCSLTSRCCERPGYVV